MVFGKSPGRDIVLGILLVVIGVSLGGLILFFLIFEPEMIEPGAQNYIVIVFLGFIVLCGMLYVVHAGKFLLVLTEHSVWEGPRCMKKEIAYRDIKGVRRDADGHVILDCENCLFSYYVPSLFNSDEERDRFVEELKRRVSEARSCRTPDSA